MSSDEMKSQFPDHKQRLAVCYHYFGTAKADKFGMDGAATAMSGSNTYVPGLRGENCKSCGKDRVRFCGHCGSQY